MNLTEGFFVRTFAFLPGMGCLHGRPAPRRGKEGGRAARGRAPELSRRCATLGFRPSAPDALDGAELSIDPLGQFEGVQALSQGEQRPHLAVVRSVASLRDRQESVFTGISRLRSVPGLVRP